MERSITLREEYGFFLHKVFKGVLNELDNALPTLGESGS